MAGRRPLTGDDDAGGLSIGPETVSAAPPEGDAALGYCRKNIVPAARSVGLGYLQHLVVITSDTNPTVAGTDWLAHPRAHVDLLVFVIRADNSIRPS